jgi:copper/silver efflux system protein
MAPQVTTLPDPKFTYQQLSVGSRLWPKLMTVCAVLASLVPILRESGIGSDVMKPIAAPIVGGMITATIHVLILVPVFFVMMKERALKRGTLVVRTVIKVDG